MTTQRPSHGEHRPSRTAEICIAILFGITAACLITAAIIEAAR